MTGRRYLLNEILTGEGYIVMLAENGVEGLKKYDEQIVDVVITDLIMTEKDGFETIIALKKKHPIVKIIVISGGGSLVAPEAPLQNALALGAVYSIMKPLDPDKVVEAVKDVLTI